VNHDDTARQEQDSFEPSPHFPQRVGRQG